MIRLLISALTLASTVLFAVLTTGPALADKRVALVIGNAQYNNPNLTLTNPKNDAEDMASSLRLLGFDVVLATNTDKKALDQAMQTFARKVTDADSALFFYAGHAMQYQGRNYIMPTDAELEDDISLRYQMIAIDDVRAALERTNGVKIMILDACRNNPLADRLARNMANLNRAIGNVRGLARVDKAQGMVVAYATASDDVAQDGSGRNSPFTSALLKRMQEAGVEVEIMFRRVTADVNSQTGGRQRPEYSSSLLNEYYLNQNDKTMWEQVKDTENAAPLREFVAKFPSSSMVPAAQTRLAALERTERDRLAEREKSDQLRNQVANLERERLDRERAERDRADRDRTDRDRADRERADRERADREAAERARVARLEADQQTAAQQAAARLASVEAARREEESCKRDQERLMSLQLGTANLRDDLVRFERELGCERLRPLVVAAIAGQAQENPSKSRTAPVPPITLPQAADTPQLIRAAQVELRRIGCFAGDDNGKMTDAMRAAVRRYLTQRGLPSDDIRINQDLVTDLQAQDKGVCPAERVASPHKPKREREPQARPARRERTASRRSAAPTHEGAPINQSAPTAAPVTVAPSVGFGGGLGRFGIRLGH